MELDSHKFACIVAQILDDKLAKDITILNISNVSSLADYFVIVTGDSTPHVKSLMLHLERCRFLEHTLQPFQCYVSCTIVKLYFSFYIIPFLFI